MLSEEVEHAGVTTTGPGRLGGSAGIVMGEARTDPAKTARAIREKDPLVYDVNWDEGKGLEE